MMQTYIFTATLFLLLSTTNAVDYCRCIIRSNEQMPYCSLRVVGNVQPESLTPYESCDLLSDSFLCPCMVAARNFDGCGCIQRTVYVDRNLTQYEYISNTVDVPVLVDNCTTNGTTLVYLNRTYLVPTYINNTVEVPYYINNTEYVYENCDDIECQAVPCTKDNDGLVFIIFTMIAVLFNVVLSIGIYAHANQIRKKIQTVQDIRQVYPNSYTQIL